MDTEWVNFGNRFVPKWAKDLHNDGETILVLESHGMGSCKNGKLNGKYISWYNNGNMKLKCNYVDGELDGKLEKRDVNGKEEIICTYKNGKMIN